MAMKQKDAVYAAFAAAQEQGLDGNAARDFAVDQVKTGLMSGDIAYSDGPIADEGKAKTYAKALIGNWLKKDLRLNGGGKYEPKTKRGPIVKDERLKELKENLASLKANGVDMAIIQRVETAYNQRKAELDAAKKTAKVKSLDETLASLAALGIDTGEAG